MNILIDSFNNVIILHKEGNKKVPSFSKVYKLDREINSYLSLIEALKTFLDKEDLNLLKNEQNNSIMLPNFGIGFGLINLPKMSKSKTLDIFMTRFRLYFPTYEKFYLDQDEYSRSAIEVSYYYSMMKREPVENILKLFKAKGISIKSIDYFAHHFINSIDHNVDFPMANLFVGKNYTELVLSNGGKVISINLFNYGETTLLDGKTYLNSAYNVGGSKASKFADFAKKNITQKSELNDANILNLPSNPDLEAPLPKELRILKDKALLIYKIKNNIRKFCSRLEDILDEFSKSPWFLPIKEVNVYSSDEFFDKLVEVSKEDSSLTFNKQIFNAVDFVSHELQNNKLFTNKIKAERRKIDWAKFFTMEIGKKKKA